MSKGTRLTLAERERIWSLRAQGLSLQAIATIVNRSTFAVRAAIDGMPDGITGQVSISKSEAEDIRDYLRILLDKTSSAIRRSDLQRLIACMTARIGE